MNPEHAARVPRRTPEPSSAAARPTARPPCVPRSAPNPSPAPRRPNLVADPRFSATRPAAPSAPSAAAHLSPPPPPARRPPLSRPALQTAHIPPPAPASAQSATRQPPRPAPRAPKPGPALESSALPDFDDQNLTVAERALYERHPAFQRLRERRAFEQYYTPFCRQSLVVQLALFLLVALLWPVPFANPIKLLVVLMHEFSHALATYATGGIVFGIEVHPGGAGVTVGMGGIPWIIGAAGYTGSLAAGVLLYRLNATRPPRDVWFLLCLFSTAMAIFGWANQFTAFYSLASAALLLAGLFLLPARWKRFILRLVATTCCLFPLLDIGYEILRSTPGGFTVHGNPVGSDAAQLALLTGAPQWMLGLASIAAGLTVLVLLIPWAARKEAEHDVRQTLREDTPPKRNRQPFRDPIYNPNDPDSIPEYTLRY